ncbi:TIGR04104 family putative zinc finger protein [Geomicrobium sediminis]|uniref:CXXC-20-CXXC protein n=1 Tax=Geomicrobium sediminis TaxID=1347788 RepID=A0ABS2PB70_9BACL|nr:TIGR04104 family putative zinc finger protein [Geomicrobium sediminis]MBM7632386.1 CXXC-20-CXXC protein [Geomicrobium sediminis]
MPTCSNCKQGWGWRLSIKKSFSIYGMSCPHCQVQYLSRNAKRKTSFLAFLPLLVPLLSLLTNLGFLAIIMIFLSVSLLFMSLYPFLMELSSEDQLRF